MRSRYAHVCIHTQCTHYRVPQHNAIPLSHHQCNTTLLFQKFIVTNNSLSMGVCEQLYEHIHVHIHIHVDVMNEVTQCAGPVSTNARSHQLCWDDREWACYISCVVHNTAVWPRTCTCILWIVCSAPAERPYARTPLHTTMGSSQHNAIPLY